MTIGWADQCVKLLTLGMSMSESELSDATRAHARAREGEFEPSTGPRDGALWLVLLVLIGVDGRSKSSPGTSSTLRLH
jgi:hypothetical protein